MATAATTVSDDAPFAGRANLRLYLAVGLVAGAVIVAADRADAGLRRRQLVAFRLGGGQPRHARLRPRERRHVHRPGLVRTPLARRRGGLAARLRPADGRLDPDRPARPLQPGLPGLRPRAEVAAPRQLPPLPHALPRRGVLPRHRLPQGARSPSRGSTSPTSPAPASPVSSSSVRCISSRRNRSSPCPLLLWAAGGVLWFAGLGAAARRRRPCSPRRPCRSPPTSRFPGSPARRRSRSRPYKGIAYARNFPDAERIYRSVSPFGDLAGLCLVLHALRARPLRQRRLQPPRPAGQHLCRPLHRRRRAGGDHAPPRRGGGATTSPTCRCSTPTSSSSSRRPSSSSSAAASRPMSRSPRARPRSPSRSRTRRSSPPSTTRCCATSPATSSAIRASPSSPMTAASPSPTPTSVYDVIDLSLADSVGLSNPGGFAIVEKYPYTREAIASYMRALAPGGVLAVTLWNKEEPPKSVLKLYATIYAAANAFDPARRGRLPLRRLELPLHHHRPLQARRLHPGRTRPPSRLYRGDVVRRDLLARLRLRPGRSRRRPRRIPRLDLRRRRGRRRSGRPNPIPASIPPPTMPTRSAEATSLLPSIRLARLFWQSLVNGTGGDVAGDYVFDTRPLTNDRPYFAAYVKPADLDRTLDRLGLFQDEWGYLLIWATFAHRLRARRDAGAAAHGLRLAHGLQPQSRQARHHPLFRLPRPRLHHGRGRADRPLHAGARQPHRLGERADRRHAGLLRPRAASPRPASSTAPAASCRSSSCSSPGFSSPMAISSIRCSTRSARLPMAGAW